jgi:hypothetical protein
MQDLHEKHMAIMSPESLMSVRLVLLEKQDGKISTKNRKKEIQSVENVCRTLV